MKAPSFSLSGTGVLGLAALVAVAGVGVWVARKGVKNAAGAVVGAASDAATGAVVGLGQVVGVPATSEDACAKARREGRTWEASFACPAGDFLRYLTEPAVDQTILDRWDYYQRGPIASEDNYLRPDVIGYPSP